MHAERKKYLKMWFTSQLALELFPLGSIDQLRVVAHQVLNAVETLQRSSDTASVETYIQAFVDSKVQHAFGQISELAQIPESQLDQVMQQFLKFGERLFREDTVFWLRGLEMLVTRTQGYRLSGMLIPMELRDSAQQLIELAAESRDTSRSLGRIEEIKVEAFELWEQLKPLLLKSNVKSTTREYR